MKPARRKQLGVISMVFLGLCAALPARSDTYIVRIPLKSRKILAAIQQKQIEILALNKDMVLDVLADDKELDYLRTLGVAVSYVPSELAAAAQAPLDANLGLYHTYDELGTELTALATAYPTLTSLTTMGTSLQGRNIYVLKISDNAATDENEPEVLIMGDLHARELMSVEIPLKFAQYLLNNYGSDAEVTQLVDGREIFIAPMLNPDGHVYVQNNHGSHWSYWWRKNRRNNGDGTFGIDLNRNFSYQWGYDNVGSSSSTASDLYRGPGAFSEPETQAIENFCQTRNFSVGFSYHSYGELLLFPWGYTDAYTTDHDVFLTLAEILVSANGYFLGNPAMGAIYNTNGDSDDWAYGETGTKPSFFLYTPEVNTYAQGGFGPSDALIQPTFDLLLPMNLALLEHADNPRAVVGPYRPTMNPVTGNGYTGYIVSWSGNDPGDPNPAVTYDVTEYKNISYVAQDGANAPSPLWNYDGFTVSTARAYEGSGSYYSGADDASSKVLEVATVYRVTPSNDVFSSWVWYDIEDGWDYAYLEVSTDGGLTWGSIPGNITTTSDPNGNNLGNGITGTSLIGWWQATFSLASFTGQDIGIRWRYVTDASVLGEGIYIDLPGPLPSYQSVRTIPGLVEPELNVVPEAPGTYTYQVVAQDADGDESRRSGTVSQTVATVAAAGEAPVVTTTLGANYPNPFNPATSIPYTVGGPRGGRPVPVSLRIYEATGRLVVTLFEDDRSPGVYREVWTATDGGGRPVPSGVYFARLAVDNGPILTRKLVVLR